MKTEITEFNKYSTYKKMAEATHKNYSFYISNYLKWLKTRKKAFKDTSHTEIIDFLAFKDKNANRPLTQNTSNLIKASLRTLYVANNKPEIAGQIHGKKVDERIPEVLSLDAIKIVIEGSQFFYKTDWKNERGYFFITLLYQTGARIGEMAKLKRADFDFDNNTVKVGSKGKEYLRKLDQLWLKSFKKWLNENNLRKEVFVSDLTTKRQWSKRTAQWFISMLCWRKLKKSYSAHRFRASCITHRLNAGEEFFSVSSNFHKNIQTTKRSMGASSRSLDKMINPYASLLKKKGV